MLSLSERGLDRWEGTPKGTVESWCKQTSLVTGILALLMKEFRGDTKSTVLKVGGAYFRAELSTLPLVTWTMAKGSLCRSICEAYFILSIVSRTSSFS